MFSYQNKEFSSNDICIILSKNDLPMCVYIYYIEINIIIVVTKSKTQIGDTVNISLTAAFFPVSGQYKVYHSYGESKDIFNIGKSKVSYGNETISTKYTYLTRPFNSTDIKFEVRDITLEDAGYYNDGAMAEAAYGEGGVVLIVLSKLYVFLQCIALLSR